MLSRRGVLQSIPIIISSNVPHGLPVGTYLNASPGRAIMLALPKSGETLFFDHSTLLREMMHQFQHEGGENSKHDAAE